MRVAVILTLVTLSQSFLIPENSSLTNSESLKDVHQDLDGNTTFVSGGDKEFRPIQKKLKEFADHAELKVETGSAEDPPQIPTPNPVTNSSSDKGVNKEKSDAGDGKPKPSQVPMEPNAADLMEENIKSITKPLHTKKTVIGPTGAPVTYSSVVAPSTKKTTVAGREGALVEDTLIGSEVDMLEPEGSGSVSPRKGVDDKQPSVVGRKGAPVKDIFIKSMTASTFNGSEPEAPITVNPSTTEEYAPVTYSSVVAPSTKKTTVGGREGALVEDTLIGSEVDVLEPEGSGSVSARKGVEDKQPSVVGRKGAPVNDTVLESMTASNFSGSEPEAPPTANPSTTEEYAPEHTKPSIATDQLDAKASEDESSGSYTPAVVGIVLLVVIIITIIIISYRRVHDVWMRRHYARMDFLIDGMYDE